MHMGMKHTFKVLSSEEIESEHQRVLDDKKYGADERLLEAVLSKYPRNDDINLVALKVALIDLTNSTQLSKYRNKIVLFDIASIIFGIKDFDERVKNGDPQLVNEIARATKMHNGDGYNLFSFSSKYCCYHNAIAYGGDAYSIYDGVVRDNLNKFVTDLRKSWIDKCREEFRYEEFNQVITELLDYNNIQIAGRRRKFDHFLWYKYRTNDE